MAIGLLVPALAEAAVAATIRWNASPDTSTVGYYVNFGIESQKYTSSIDVGNTTSAVFYLPEPVDPALTYYLAVQAYSSTGARGQLSAEIVFKPSQAPTLRNPGNMNGVAGLSITPFQLGATDPRGLPLTYAAGGLPPGLAISSSTGRISGTPTKAGSYRVTVAATNSSDVSAIQLFTWTIVGPTTGENNPGPGIAPGEPAPMIQILSPTDRPYRTMNTRIIVTGIASDEANVASIMWANSRGGAGTSLGTSSWSTTPIDLKMGDNVITITARDAIGNVETVTFTVTRIVDYENHLN